jgi:hypothetical protein
VGSAIVLAGLLCGAALLAVSHFHRYQPTYQIIPN